MNTILVSTILNKIMNNTELNNICNSGKINTIINQKLNNVEFVITNTKFSLSFIADKDVVLSLTLTTYYYSNKLKSKINIHSIDDLFTILNDIINDRYQDVGFQYTMETK